MVKIRQMQVIVTDEKKYFELTNTKKNNGGKVKHYPEEVEELIKCDCIKLTKLQEKILAKNQAKAKEENVLSEESRELLENPDLLNILVKEVGKSVAGEEDTILAMGLIGGGGRLVKNANKTSFNIIPNDESGMGKDYTTKKTLEIFVPEEELISRARISPKVLNYWHNAHFEKDWTWDGKVLYLMDVSDEVLNSEVVKTFTSDEGTATIVKQNMAVDLKIEGKPVLFSTTANSTPGKEQLRRFKLLPLDSSEEQTKRIMQFTAQKEVEGKTEASSEIINAIKCLERTEAVVPFAHDIWPHFPNASIVRTAFGTFLDWIKASACLHQYQRERDDQGRIIATYQDYEYGKKAFMKTCEEGIMPITKNQRMIIDMIHKELDCNKGNKMQEDHNFWTTKEISAKINFMNHSNVWLNLNQLVEVGYLEKGSKEVERAKTISGEEERISTNEVIAFKITDQEDFLLPDVSIIKGDTK